MIDLRVALERCATDLANKQIDLITYRNVLKRVLIDQIKEVPAEFSLGDLHELCREKGFVSEVRNGEVRINIPPLA